MNQLKKILCILVCLAIALGTALGEETATEGKTLIIRGWLAVTSMVPEGYTMSVLSRSSESVLVELAAEEEDRPVIEVRFTHKSEHEGMKMNDLPEEEIQALIREAREDYEQPEEVDTETEYGTRLIAVYENTPEVCAFDIFSMWNGYWIEVHVTGPAGYVMDAEKLALINHILSSMWIFEAPAVTDVEEDPVEVLDEYHGVGAEEPWITEQRSDK